MNRREALKSTACVAALLALPNHQSQHFMIFIECADCAEPTFKMALEFWKKNLRHLRGHQGETWRVPIYRTDLGPNDADVWPFRFDRGFWCLGTPEQVEGYARPMIDVAIEEPNVNETSLRG